MKDKTSNLNLQQASLDIYKMKYQLKDKNSNPVDTDVKATFSRVAETLAIAYLEGIDCASSDFLEEKTREYMWAMENGAIPAGRIIANAGAFPHKKDVSLINCVVSNTIEDSMKGILDALHDAGMALKAGCGIGYEFSTLRPAGSYVNGAGAFTTGPLPFMEVFDKLCGTVASAGGRRGAQMATFDINHPDVVEFITAKRKDGMFRKFNFSVLVDREFMRKVEKDEKHVFTFKGKTRDYTGKEYGSVMARDLWHMIMSSNYEFAEPGVIFIDNVNEKNNLYFMENIRASNPCGEQMLPPNGSCLLGSIDLTKLVKMDDISNEFWFDWSTFENVVWTFHEMLDNVVEINGLPLQAMRDELVAKRRHGMGFFGLASVMSLLGMRYGSKDSIEFASRIAMNIAKIGLRKGISLAEDKGCCPVLNLERNRRLFARSPMISKILASCDDSDDLYDRLMRTGIRYTHWSSIAPTGTIATSLGNNASSGIEPTFDHKYTRNVIVEGQDRKSSMNVYSSEYLMWKQLEPNCTASDLPYWFATTNDIDPDDHLIMQAAVQEWVDSSISKTINVPTDIPFEKFKNIYIQAYNLGLKGCTTFRFNPEVFQGVLVREDDLKNTVYKFTTLNGEVIEVRGDQEVEYNGEVGTAANLFDYLKEGQYSAHIGKSK